jgi:hypothetical protein
VDPAELKQLCDTLQRHAGWLDRERTSVTVRAAVQALGAAIAAGVDASSLLHALDTSIARLPSGELRKMLRVGATEVRRALAEAG